MISTVDVLTHVGTNYARSDFYFIKISHLLHCSSSSAKSLAWFPCSVVRSRSGSLSWLPFCGFESILKFFAGIFFAVSLQRICFFSRILTFMNICTILFLLSNESKAGKPDLILINQRSFCPLLKTWIASWGQTPLLCQKHFIFHERSILLMELSQFNKQIFNKWACGKGFSKTMGTNCPVMETIIHCSI